MREQTLTTRVEAAIGVAPTDIRPLGGGCIGQVYALDFADKERLVVKVDDRSQPTLDVEGYMLRYLAEHSDLPVPDVHFSSPRLLVMAFIGGDSHFGAAAQRHAAELLAALHGVRAPRFGLERETLIGSLPQPNPWTDRWIDFFREHRLHYMARVAEEEGPLSAGLRRRIETFAAQLERWLEEPAHPSLIHGDVWTTNVLAQDNRITGFVDPAIYYAHPEIELAFSTLFGTFGASFLAAVTPVPSSES
jgi:fructosamine-3-kinase